MTNESAPMSKPRYIGDGVSVDFEYGSIVLTTSDGLRDTNRIVLDPDVWAALKACVELEKEKSREDR